MFRRANTPDRAQAVRGSPGQEHETTDGESRLLPPVHPLLAAAALLRSVRGPSRVRRRLPPLLPIPARPLPGRASPPGSRGTPLSAGHRFLARPARAVRRRSPAWPRPKAVASPRRPLHNAAPPCADRRGGGTDSAAAARTADRAAHGAHRPTAASANRRRTVYPRSWPCFGYGLRLETATRALSGRPIHAPEPNRPGDVRKGAVQATGAPPNSMCGRKIKRFVSVLSSAHSIKIRSG